MPARIKLECRGRLRSVVVSSRRPDGRVKRERANPITPIVDMTSGHVHYVRLGPAVRHAAGRTLAYFHEGQIHIRPEYAENLMFYEELCRLGDPTRGVEPSQKSWAKFEALREVLYKGVQPENMPKDFYHPHVVELRKRGNSVPLADMAEVLDRFGSSAWWGWEMSPRPTSPRSCATRPTTGRRPGTWGRPSSSSWPRLRGRRPGMTSWWAGRASTWSRRAVGASSPRWASHTSPSPA
ncbi:hypothetical protein [Plesiocystis pacifica]|uniref:hypothetical protein n=1 Tax=Plesiocystis pacifica TaxID=191768 RepID=UPI0012FAAD98|nr:hypothetical protein [Plesiocystis pacifica]